MIKKTLLRLVLAVALLPQTLLANSPVTKSNYELPARFSTEKVKNMVFSTIVEPTWMKNSQKFIYPYKTSDGVTWYIVDPAKGSKKPLFDRAKIAAQITKAVGDPYDAQHLPIGLIKLTNDDNIVKFEVKSSVDIEKKDEKTGKPKKEKKVHGFQYNIATATLTEIKDYETPKSQPSWANVSPDGKRVIFSRDFNLYWMSAEDMEKAKKNEDDSTIVEHKITTEGVKNNAFGSGYDSRGEYDMKKIAEEMKKRRSAYAVWSPDSKHFVTLKIDTRHVRDFWVINSLSQPRPTLEEYKYQMPGETEAPIYSLYLFNANDGSKRAIKTNRFKNQTLEVHEKPTLKKDASNPNPAPSVWLGNNEKFLISITSRDLKRIDVCEVEVTADSARTIIAERMNTYLDSRPLVPIKNFTEYIHWSERDGWAHLYIYDNKGNMKRQITEGEFHVESINGVDEKNGYVYFTANGREKNENPYYEHLYRVKLDGSNLTLLNKGNFFNETNLNDECRYFVNNYSRVDCAPKSALYDNTGKKILDLEATDLSKLFEAGYKFPEIFKVKAGDGVTDLYGVMYKPYNFDSTKLYPIIEYVYPGPQTEAVDCKFTRPNIRTDRLAQFGFVVITVGNRGGHPSRSKWYHNYGYGNMRDYGLEDKKVVVEQLAGRHNFIDISKVGIHGHSGGGFMSTAAMLVYPNFFKVAVSCAGNHDNSIYNRWWSEKHHGVKEEVSEKGDTTFKYSVAKNHEIAANLKGKLMLVTGDMDNNVNPANTIRVVDALMKANKRFDMLIIPGARHSFGDSNEYFFWRLGDYFSKNLIGDSQESNTDIYQLMK